MGAPVPHLAGGLSVKYRCHAKINLTLEILGRRPDGYHDLASLVHTISLFDDLRIEPGQSILTRTRGLEVESDANLVTRAAQQLALATGSAQGAELTLDKGIPAAAGLGGGSSDAAAALVGLDLLWQTRLAPARLTHLAAQIGADVPFFLQGGAALMEGRGDRLTALPSLEQQWLVLLAPRHALRDKTARLYAALSPADFSDGQATRRAAECLEGRQATERADLPNGFARAARAVFSGLDRLWRQAEEMARRPFFLSGAGPSLFAFANDGSEARALAGTMRELGEPTFAVQTVDRARVPVGNGTSTPIGYP